MGAWADFLRRHGAPVYDLAGIPWRVYRNALIPATAMPRYPRLVPQEVRKLLWESKALFLRCGMEPTNERRNWWHIVCANYRFSMLSRNSRSKTRRGLKRFELRLLTPQWIAKNGYRCHRLAYERYKYARPLREKKFQASVLATVGEPVFEYWGALQSGELGGYFVCIVEDDGVFFHTIDITPQALKDYAAYALIHRLLDHYVEGRGLPVSNGSRAIAHATNMQDFLTKFGFNRKFCTLKIVYRPDIALAVSLLYPLRKPLAWLPAGGFIHSVRSVLEQERIWKQEKHS